ncbi:hypothetical protein HXX76_014779 [Chlamydomonas incerta]|nr:hypothetical protein HXX76_014779 [Chlamydomonas incerta]|eukprot:KAG2424104.1 hypothetical protein HXX76_014779 [Chlamydomonas incerta]
MSTGKRTRTRNRSLRWTAWCRDAFIALDDHQGTTDDICAVLLANPKIAPLLDHRVRADKRSVPQWRNQVFCIARKVPGVVKTGEKRGGRAIYRYDPEAAALLAAGAKRTRRTKARGGKGESSMPHLGAAQ